MSNTRNLDFTLSLIDKASTPMKQVSKNIINAQEMVSCGLKTIQGGKGIGNFKTMYLHIPNGKEDGFKLMPVGDIGQKDEFEKIKRISGEDVCAAHRIPGALMGIAPQNAGGFGAIDKITAAYYTTEVAPSTKPWLFANEFLPLNMQFKFNIQQNKE